MYERKFTYTAATTCLTPTYPGKCAKTQKQQNKNCRNKFQGLLYFKRAPRRGNNLIALDYRMVGLSVRLSHAAETSMSYPINVEVRNFNLYHLKKILVYFFILAE